MHCGFYLHKSAGEIQGIYAMCEFALISFSGLFNYTNNCPAHIYAKLQCGREHWKTTALGTNNGGKLKLFGPDAKSIKGPSTFSCILQYCSSLNR